MRTVKYSELSRAMHDFTKQIDTLDECIEVGLVAVAAKNFKYAGCTIVR